jgi:hypothetical protein
LEQGTRTQLAGITNNHNLKDDWWHLLPSNTKGVSVFNFQRVFGDAQY